MPHRLWLVLVAACGRFDFDVHGSDGSITGDGKPACVPVGHDEDGDGVDDACDGCPHIADPDQPDMDHDGVDDACDPHPTVPGDAIVFFDPFITVRPVWMPENGAAPVSDGEGWPVSAIGSFWAVTRTVTSVHDLFQIGAHIGSAGSGAGQFAVAINDVNNLGDRFFCSLYNSGSAETVSMGWTYSPGSGFSTNEAPATWPLENGSAAIAIRELGDDEVACTGQWQGTINAQGIIPTGTPTTAMGFAVQNMDAEIDYAIQISSP